MFALRKFLPLIVATLFASGALAGGRSHSSSSSSSGTVHVSGYYRQNGTYVAPYTRRAPGTATDASESSTQTSGGAGTLAEKTAAENPETTLPKVEAREQALPNGVTTAEECARKLANEERRAANDYYKHQARIIGLDKNGNPILATNIARNSHGRIQRSESAKREFMRLTGYSKGRPGYVVDHIIPLAKGGADDPSNMQWQTTEEAKAKDKWERK